MWNSFFFLASASAMEAEIQATFEHCGSFNSKLKDTLTSLLNANNDRKAEIDSLRSDHDALQQAHDAFQNSMERENDLRKNEIRSLEERQQKDNQVMCDVFQSYAREPLMRLNLVGCSKRTCNGISPGKWQMRLV